MKRIISAVLLSAMIVCISGCNTDKTSAPSVVLSEAPAPASSQSDIPIFTRPAETFDYDNATSDQAAADVRIDYDEQGRIKECFYTTETGMECDAIYTYNDTYAHIFTFGGSNLVDDLIIHCEYSEGAAPIVIKGYYFINRTRERG